MGRVPTAVKYTSKNGCDFAGGPVVRILLPLQGAWVQSLVGELNSLMLCAVAKKKKAIAYMDKYNIFLAVNITGVLGALGF